MAASKPLIDALGRRITYLRVSVTDRCDLRCVYCMSERMTFADKPDVLAFDELDRLCALFIERGVRKLRITGGEPLLRKGIDQFFLRLRRHLDHGALDELTLTTNGTQLSAHANALAKAGIERVNVSLDTINPNTFAKIARSDRLPMVLAGIEATRAAGLKVKLNTVALRGVNEHEIPSLVRWAHERDMEITLIETMPLGEIDEDRTGQFVPLTDVRRDLEKTWTLDDERHCSGGPARYVHVRETGGRLGFITPITNVFCATCNRVRLTCKGELFMCLGRDDRIDLGAALRAGASDAELDRMLDQGMQHKPAAHDFRIEPARAPAVQRYMSVTGG